MAMSQMKIQKAALKTKAVDKDAKLHQACFGVPHMADGGYMHHTKRYDQTGSPGMANGGVVAESPPMNPNFLPNAAAGGGLFGQALAQRAQAMTGVFPQQKQVIAGIPPPVNTGAPVTFVPGEPSTMNPAQLAAYHAAHGIQPAPSMLQTVKSVFGFASGGKVVGPGTGTSDSVPIQASHGEYILPADTVKAIGVDKLDAIKAATHTPVKAKFGMANGGDIPRYPVDPAGGVGNVNVPPPSQGASAQAQAFRTQPPYQQAPQMVEAPAAAAAPAAETAAAAAPKNLFGRAASAIGSGASKVGAVAGGTYNLAKNAVKFAAGPVVQGALLASHSADVGSGSDVLRDATTGEITNKTQGTATTPAFQALSDGDKYAMIQERNDKATHPARVAQIAQFMDGAPATVDPSAKYGAPSTESQVPGATNVVPSAPHSMGPEDPNDNYQPVNDTFVPPDTQIFGRGRGSKGQFNDYVGAGPHLDTSTGSPADQAAQAKIAGYRAELAGGNQSGMSAGPNYQESPQAQQIRSQIFDTSQKLNALKPGELGRGPLLRSLAGLEAAHAQVHGVDEQKNAFEAAKFGRAQELKIHQQGIANQTLGYGVQAAGNNLTFQAKMAEVNNTAHQNAFQRSQALLGNSKDRITALAKAGGFDPEVMQVLASTHQFMGSDGKPHNYADLDEASRVKADAALQESGEQATALRAAGRPYSLTGADKETGVGPAGWIAGAVKSGNPMGAITQGVTQTNGMFGTSRVRNPVTHEQARVAAGRTE